MPKVNNIAESTAHAQHAEAAALLGAQQPKSDSALQVELDEAQAEVEALTGKLAALQADYDALKSSNDALVQEHEAVQATLKEQTDAAPPATEDK